MRTPLVKALTILIVVDGLALALAVLPTLQYAVVHRRLPKVAGIRALSGPFEALGIDAFAVAGLLFVAVSALKLLAAYWIWNSRMDGIVLELILLGLSSVFWYGFALPFPPLVGIAQIILIALSWRTFS